MTNLEPVGSIPEFLKYSYKGLDGNNYCYNVMDLYNLIQRSPNSHDPYRRFTLDSAVAADVTERMNFLEEALEPDSLKMYNVSGAHLEYVPMQIQIRKIQPHRTVQKPN